MTPRRRPAAHLLPLALLALVFMGSSCVDGSATTAQTQPIVPTQRIVVPVPDPEPLPVVEPEPVVVPFVETEPTPTYVPEPEPIFVPEPIRYEPDPEPVYTAPAQTCCKVCRKGKACGDSCISRSYTCHKGPGCACDAY